MVDKLKTMAEKEALKAEELRSFSGLKLLHIKRQIAELLGQIGKEGIFYEYTKHDISHIDEMLKILDWLLPESMRKIMTQADWLIVVMGIYFHDLGMLVTHSEYENRHKSGFKSFCEEILFSGDKGVDYQKNIEELEGDERDRFLYQEFVRHKHAERVHQWIMGKAAEHRGVTPKLVKVVNDLLGALPDVFRRDLALVCESHHLDDLYDFEKYKVSQPYGNSKEETANLQYAAVLLRVTDLLHMTKDRTSSIVYRVIDPSNPVSQREWAKQMAVRAVRAKLGLDRDGKPDEKAPRDTIEVHAYFTKPEGFFALTAYLSYVEEQLKKSRDWVERAKIRKGSKYEFPWCQIDDSQIETEGFLRESFQFTLDQAKVLDLLTGHRLYNDVDVVIRELAQNAIDAVRLQKLIDQKQGTKSNEGKIEIDWNSQQGTLSIRDNGTGMTQQVIEKHLLKVGASRYQDEDFRKLYPEFSPISRFGIGVLSAFMIADKVDIITCHADEPEARILSLRSLHGKYLVQLIDKESVKVSEGIHPHGTVVRVKVRASAKVPDVLETAKKWIVVPRCEVIVCIDGNSPVKVGHTTIKDALEESLKKVGVLGRGGMTSSREIRVEEKEIKGVALAYALKWSQVFKEWSFVSLSDVESIAKIRRTSTETKKEISLGICLEGIRVNFDTPGYSDLCIISIANVVGSDGPKTNVARYGIEVSEEYDRVLSSIYSIYSEHIISESRALNKERNFSLHWAAEEARYLCGDLFPERETPSLFEEYEPVNITNKELLLEKTDEIPILVLEEEGKQDVTSVSVINKKNAFWTVECPFYQQAELLMREVEGIISIRSLIGGVDAKGFMPPDGPLLYGLGGLRKEDLRWRAFKNKEVDTINIKRERRMLDLRWVKVANPSRCVDVCKTQRYMSQRIIWIRKSVSIVGSDSETAVMFGGALYILPGSSIHKYLGKIIDIKENSREMESRWFEKLMMYVIQELLPYGSRVNAITLEEFTRYILKNIVDEEETSEKEIAQCIDIEELFEAIKETTWDVFNPWAWKRQSTA